MIMCQISQVHITSAPGVNILRVLRVVIVMRLTLQLGVTAVL